MGDEQPTKSPGYKSCEEIARVWGMLQLMLRLTELGTPRYEKLAAEIAKQEAKFTEAVETHDLDHYEVAEIIARKDGALAIAHERTIETN